MRKLVSTVVAVMSAVVPVVVMAPRSGKTDGARGADELIWALRDAGLRDRELVDAAMQRVAAEYTHESLWHMWESPDTSLARGRGWSHQYNTVLCDVLRGLGFEAHLVHAARVRGFRHPWWYAGHTWVEVIIDGRQHHACASRVSNRLGDVGFTPVTAELPYRNVTRLGVALALTPFVAVGVWRAWLTGRPVSRWIYRER
ncbi:transglutaminase domain-containing protein [Tessaracoccus antarcticus]|uniref:Transglutaminase-like domain-containing protein n=1 Tax=Tessaracoccus antarcticus TaxID=2479848 RepID=A0A3M0G011_9ACTN|nr:transglutaminase domain-containing protein [Tessaracoccus antarcticus]RMB58321.1 hypothetical protein EAX62_14065 [Tessaracoccus antarcticus]